MEETYRVVKIIDTENIVINAGKDNYIKKGDKFEIYSVGKEIYDLDGNSLGTLDTIKETVTAVSVFPKMCICQKIVNVTPSYLAAAAKTMLSTKEIASLDVDSKDFSGGLSDDKTIHIGDLARLTD